MVKIKSQTIGWAICLVAFIYIVMSFTIHNTSTQILAKIRNRPDFTSMNSPTSGKDDVKSKGSNLGEQMHRETIIKIPDNDSFKIVSQDKTQAEKRCVHHVAFLKVHKTASSTAQNVFLRYGNDRNLSFVLPHTKGESGWLNVISYVNSVTHDNIVPAPKDQPFDLLCCHVIYDRQSFEAVLPRDTFYIGIVREPISRFQSAIKYFSPRFILKLAGEKPLSIYAKNPLAYEPPNPRQSQTNNRMAVEFGFPTELFPGKSLNGSQKDIDSYLQKLDDEFNFIIISEFFDESMILMKRILGWDTKDVLYVDKNVAKQATSPNKVLPEEAKDAVRKFLYLDTALYNYALKRFNKLVDEGGVDFRNEVDTFKSERKLVTDFCFHSKDSIVLIKSTRWHEDYYVSKQDCKLFSKHEKDLIQKQRFRMYGTLDN